MTCPVTLITGTSRGIGRALAEHYLGKGHIVVGCSRNPSDFSASSYRHFELDVSNEPAALDLFRAVRMEFGRLDHLINNAAIATMNHALLTPLSSVEAIMRTNVLGPFLMCREACKLMTARRYGRIVNFGTVAVPLRIKGEAAYAASKAAVLSLTQVLAYEVAELGITVNAVCPGPVKTDLIRGIPEDRIQELLDRQAIQRFSTTGDIVNVIDFYLRPESQFITGQTIYLGGI